MLITSWQLTAYKYTIRYVAWKDNKNRERNIKRPIDWFYQQTHSMNWPRSHTIFGISPLTIETLTVSGCGAPFFLAYAIKWWQIYSVIWDKVSNHDCEIHMNKQLPCHSIDNVLDAQFNAMKFTQNTPNRSIRYHLSVFGDLPVDVARCVFVTIFV